MLPSLLMAGSWIVMMFQFLAVKGLLRMQCCAVGDLLRFSCHIHSFELLMLLLAGLFDIKKGVGFYRSSHIPLMEPVHLVEDQVSSGHCAQCVCHSFLGRNVSLSVHVDLGWFGSTLMQRWWWCFRQQR